MEKIRQIELFRPEDKLPTDQEWVLAYCNTDGYEDCYVEPEVVYYNLTSHDWFTKEGVHVTNVNYWFRIPELE